MSYFGNYAGHYFGNWYGQIGSGTTAPAVSGYYPSKRKRKVAEAVFSEFKEALQRDEPIPAAQIKKLRPIFDESQFKNIETDIEIINQRIELLRGYDELSKERADLRKLMFILEQMVLQQIRLFEEDEELIIFLTI